MSETKIIAFEGIDGTGKSVQMEALREKLTQRGLRAVCPSRTTTAFSAGAWAGI